MSKPERLQPHKNKIPWRLYSMCAIPMLLVFVFSYIPMYGVIIAFKNYRYNEGILGSQWAGLRYFKLFFAGKTFTRILRNTLVMNFLFITTGTVACIVLAALLYYVRSRRATKTFQTMLITPNFVSYVIVGYVVFAILSPVSGTLNVLMQKVGLKKIDWYTKPDAWWWILPIVNIWKGVGMGSILYYATFMGIDPGLFEAAELDGANSLQKFWHVMLPSIKTILIIQTILNIGNIFSADFGMFYNVTRNVSALYPTTDVLNTYIYRIMRVDGNLSLSAAAGLAQSVVGMILVIATNAIVRKIEPESSLF